jgi:hypothetical protein
VRLQKPQNRHYRYEKRVEKITPKNEYRGDFI